MGVSIRSGIGEHYSIALGRRVSGMRELRNIAAREGYGIKFDFIQPGGGTKFIACKRCFEVHEVTQPHACK